MGKSYPSRACLRSWREAEEEEVSVDDTRRDVCCRSARARGLENPLLVAAPDRRRSAQGWRGGKSPVRLRERLLGLAWRADQEGEPRVGSLKMFCQTAS